MIMEQFLLNIKTLHTKKKENTDKEHCEVVRSTELFVFVPLF